MLLTKKGSPGQETRKRDTTEVDGLYSYKEIRLGDGKGHRRPAPYEGQVLG